MTFVDPQTGNVVVGDPANPPPQNVPQNQPNRVTEPPPANTRYYTEKELNEERERIRQEEKSKLYPQLDTYKARVKEFEDAAAEAQRQEEQRQAAEAETQRQQALEENDAKKLIEQERQERLAMQIQWEHERAEMQAQLAQRDAILDQERRFAVLEKYRLAAVAANQDHIFPELVSLISGSSEDEIDTSVQEMINRTQQILGNVQAAADEGQRQIPTASVNSPAMGPESWVQGQRTYTADQIKNMPMSEYQKVRAQFGMREDDNGRSMFR